MLRLFVKQLVNSFYRFFAVCKSRANLALGVLLVYCIVCKVTSAKADREPMPHAFGASQSVAVTPIEPSARGIKNPGYDDLLGGVWIKIHQQASNDPESFTRQTHGGATFDPVRGRIILFGSDTHGVNWDNTVRYFDMAALTWSYAYPPDDPTTYRVNQKGFPVAGINGDRPWAMHTFDAIEFDSVSDRLIVASHPGHLSPKKPWGVNPVLWKKIESHPTWVYHIGTNRWTPLTINGESFFPYGMTFDPERRRVLGVKPSGIWELDIDSGEWQTVGSRAPAVWHNAAVFDSDRDVVLSFGSNGRSNSVWQYRIGDDSAQEMPTPGVRPPGASSPPLVYHPGIKRVVALVENESGGAHGSTETWLYSTGDDSWEKLKSATLPFAIGMNYSMLFDPNHVLLVLVASMPNEDVAIWTLKVPD